jgi:hypothetical protein
MNYDEDTHALVFRKKYKMKIAVNNNIIVVAYK